MKRFLTPAIALIAAGAALAGCGSAATDGGETTSAAADAQPASSIEAVYTYDQFFTAPLSQLTDELSRREGIDTKLVLAGENYEDAFARIQNDLAAGNPPDLAMVGLNRLQPLVDAGVVTPLDDLVANDPDFDIGQYDERFLDTMRLDGRLYGLPYAVSTAILYVNADVFRRAGLDPEQPPQTWEEVAQAAQQIVDRGAARHGVWYGWDLTGNWLFQNLLESNGGQLMDAGKQQATFNDAAGVEVVDHWRELVERRLMPPLDSVAGPEAFYRGDVGMMVWSTAALAAAQRSSGFPIRTGLLPIPAAGARATPAGGNGFVILAEDDAHRSAAWEALKAFTSPEGSTLTTELTGYMPVNRVAAESPRYLKAFLQEANRRTAIEQIPTLRPWFSFPGRRGVEITDAINDAIFAAMTGRKPTQEALDEAAATVEDLAAQGAR
jgi:multiple sugar transport system substrate-binding protein